MFIKGDWLTHFLWKRTENSTALSKNITESKLYNLNFYFLEHALSCYMVNIFIISEITHFIIIETAVCQNDGQSPSTLFYRYKLPWKTMLVQVHGLESGVSEFTLYISLSIPPRCCQITCKD